MRSVVRSWLPIASLASLFAPLAFVSSSAVAAPPDARTWLTRIHTAAYERNYQGTLVVSANGVVSSSRIAHFAVGDQSYERVEALDGRQQRVYRVNDSVHTVWPQAGVAIVENRPAASRLPGSRRSVDPRALDFYDARLEGVERVAGRDAQVLLLQPRDGWRYAQRLWADKATGLMLRADIVGPNRTVLESTAFSAVELGVRPQPESVTQPLRKLEGYRVVRAQQSPTELEAEGWQLEHPVTGFRLVGAVKRPLEAAAKDEVLQAVFTDGLTHVSIFVEPLEARRDYADLAGQVGATGTLRQRRGLHWITVMGDVPPLTLKAFAEALQRRR
ncbi:MucB/RseB C-terminal domain-containing protein [Rubrivivax gelatinosus]|uniref:MucB/RseB-like sigma(E) regulatory protein n=1 Tax=Rubrivivax gelatinosus TaxID=28068 RepID=A0A4R2M5Q1_RUBGE|nr:MucB/RseB C-terminal domain-containing protein [Rubrivivax gelatinosus]MBK1688196.1 transcriptional regulator [Rubrivivax gelatinosus]TCP02559.1 MucB/RseB-like sigma(E) regulatory protein [Rubrivivax gelatinosus]